MNSRIDYLKTLTKKNSSDIEAYSNLTSKYYDAVCDKTEIDRKAHFLKAFASEIPVVIDENELLVGSMRFWDALVPSRNKGHIIVDYRMILSIGISGIKQKISLLNTDESKAFRDSIDAFSLFIERYAKAAQSLYEKGGKEDMKTVFENCFYILKNPPKTFHQALQLVWFVHLFLHAEAKAPAVSFGRFDDYMYPFYKNDIENGIMSVEESKELLMCFWLKCCEGDESQNLTVGGNKENELTYLCCDVTSELKVQQPSLSVRICEDTSEKLWQKTTQVVKSKIGMPAIFNDSIVIKALKNSKVEEIDAENYAIVGCYEANSDGNTFGTTANASMFYLHDVLLPFLDYKTEYCDFDELYHAFKTYLTQKYNTELLSQFRKDWEFIRNECVSPFQSACMSGCLESGISAERGGCKYTMAGINILGIGTLVDSLYAIKKVVFENNEYSFKDFVNQVKNNFPDKVLMQKCKNLKGKFGTDSEETNEMARDLSLLIADLVENGEIYEGVTAYAGLFVFLHDVNSQNYPATPDGRLAGERTSYGIGASDFCTDKTLTTMLNSSAKIANDRFADGNPLMFSIPEKLVAGEDGDKLLKNLIQGYFKNGGFHLQINVTDAETLKKAKENPEEYNDLIVRISGYSEYFNKLDDAIKNSLIERS